MERFQALADGDTPRMPGNEPAKKSRRKGKPIRPSGGEALLRRYGH